jgi:hypothetical protein
MGVLRPAWPSSGRVPLGAAWAPATPATLRKRSPPTRSPCSNRLGYLLATPLHLRCSRCALRAAGAIADWGRLSASILADSGLGSTPPRAELCSAGTQISFDLKATIGARSHAVGLHLKRPASRLPKENVAMLMLLRALHAIAAQRGDGLRPELVQMISQSPPCTGSDRAAEVPKKATSPTPRAKMFPHTPPPS